MALDVVNTRRTSFSDADLHVPHLDEPDQLLAALENPTAENVLSALEAVCDVQARFAQVQHLAREKACEGGESDYRRLKRSHSSLKNSFMHYEVKDVFMESLIEGQPDGEEGERLREYERQLEGWAQELGQQKERNEELRKEIGGAIGGLASSHAELAAVQQEMAREAAEWRAQVEQHSAARPKEQLPALDDEEAELQEQLEHQTAEARQLEGSLSAVQGELLEAEAALQAEGHEVQALHAQVQHHEALAQEQQQEAQEKQRFTRQAEWCDAVRQTMAQLSGVELLTSDGRNGTLRLKITTHVPAGSKPPADAPGCSSQGTAPDAATPDGHIPLREYDHTLTLEVEPDGRTPSTASLDPPDVPVNDIVEAASSAAGGGAHRHAAAGQQQQQQQRPLGFLVREVSARLSQRLTQRALTDEAQHVAGFPLLHCQGDVWRAVLPSKVEAELLLPPDWPSPGCCPLELLALQSPVAGQNLDHIAQRLRARPGMQPGATDMRAPGAIDMRAPGALLALLRAASAEVDGLGGAQRETQ